MNIRLITNKINSIGDYLHKNGLIPAVSRIPLTENDAARLALPSEEYILLELNSDSLNDDQIIWKLFKTINDKNRIIFIADAVSLNIKKLLLQKGVSEVLSPVNPGRVVSYIKEIASAYNTLNGKIAILENEPPVIKILNYLIRRFGYEPHFVESMESLETHIKKGNLQLILLNIEINRTIINGLIKKSVTDGETKKIPIISYKNMEKGLFVHEIVSGLNRITKVILSLEELYGYLTGLLIKKRIMPLMEILNISLDYNNNDYFSKKTLNQVYYINEKVMMSDKDIFTDKNFERIVNSLDDMKQSILFAEALKWLRIDCNREDFNTFGGNG